MADIRHIQGVLLFYGNFRFYLTDGFEELGVDRLYIDEAHLFKNRFFNTKMGRNVSGINASSASQRAEDLAMKVRYLDEITDSRGTTFATGTPIHTLYL